MDFYLMHLYLNITIHIVGDVILLLYIMQENLGLSK